MSMGGFLPGWRVGLLGALLLIVGSVPGCVSVPLPPDGAEQPAVTAPAATAAPPVMATTVLGPSLIQGRSRWQPVAWSDLPGFLDDSMDAAWNAWLRSCERPAPAFVAICPEVRRLTLSSPDEQRAWMAQRLQPYRVEPLQGPSEGLLTGYYEPVLEASRRPTATQTVPLYRPPSSLTGKRPWYTREQIATLPEAQAALRGREIAYVADPLDALSLEIQGSGRVRVTEPDGSRRLVRLAFAGSNDQPYRSVGNWLLQQGSARDASWPGIKAWVAEHPQRLNELLWSNPRSVFFREEPLSELDAASGPRGAQGVPLTPGRSIAVDKDSIPYGTPVWLASTGPQLELRRLVLAQDTGAAIVGALRADYFTGWGPQAGDLAGRLKQPLQLWVLWPK